MGKNALNLGNLDRPLSYFAPKDYVQHRDLGYGSVKGTCEIIGYQIILFRREGQTKNAALSIDWKDDRTQAILSIGNKILEYLNAPVLLGDDFHKAIDAFGQPDFSQELFMDSTTHYFLDTDEERLIRLTVNKNAEVIDFELIQDAELIQERIETLKNN